MEKQKLLVWDVGGVLIQLSFEKFHEAMGKAANKPANEVKTLYNSSGLETRSLIGELTTRQYLDGLNSVMGTSLSDEQLLGIVEKTWAGTIDEVVQIKERLRAQGVPTAIFSNIGKTGYEILSNLHPEVFAGQHQTYSFRKQGLLKPNRLGYKEINDYAKAQGLPGVVFVEDKAAYLETGIDNFNWGGILFTGRVDKAEAIRQLTGHQDKKPNEKIIVVDTPEKLEQELNKIYQR